MIKVRQETEFSELDFQAFICIGEKPQEAIVSRGKKIWRWQRKIVGSEGRKHKGSQKTRIQFYNGVGYIQLPFTHLVSKNNNKKRWNYLCGIAY